MAARMRLRYYPDRGYCWRLAWVVPCVHYDGEHSTAIALEERWVGPFASLDEACDHARFGGSNA